MDEAFENRGECLLAICHQASTLGVAAYSEIDNTIYCGAVIP